MGASEDPARPPDATGALERGVPDAPAASGLSTALRSPWLALLLWALACGPRLAFALWVHPIEQHISSDMWVYSHRAHNLLSGDLGPWDTFTPVGYPALVALLLWLGGDSLRFVAAVQAVLGAATAPLMHRLGCRIDRGPWLPPLAGLLAAVHLPFVFYSGFLLTEVVTTTLLCALIWLLLRAREQPRIGRWLSAGLALGVTTVVRPNLLAFWPLLVVWLALDLRARRQDLIAALCWTLLAAAGPVTAAASHNSRLLGKPSGLGTNGGLNFFLNFSDISVGRHRDRSGTHTIAPIPNITYNKREAYVPKPFYDQEYYYRRGLQALREDPSLLWRARRNLRDGAGAGKLSYWPGWHKHSKLLKRYGRGFFWAAIVPALAWLALLAWQRQLLGRQCRAQLLLGFLTLSATAVMFFFLGDPRIRVPFDAPLLLLALGFYATVLRAGMRLHRGRA